MVQFKRIFLGQDPRPYVRATTCQKCVRAGGKHNDLEQVGHTRRHHTFFEMLGNFSFGDYFKREAITFAWEFVTSPKYLGLPPERLRVTVHHTDDEARGLWREITGLPDTTASTVWATRTISGRWATPAPAAPAPRSTSISTGSQGDAAKVYSQAEFEELGRGRTLPRDLEPGVHAVRSQCRRHTDAAAEAECRHGAGLERITAVMQGQDDNFHTDAFRPLIADVERLVGAKYPGGPEGTGISYRVLADHARSVSFLLLDGVYPGNDGRGFVLRRILRRAVRHAWLLGRREPTLVHLVPTVVALMGDAYPELVREEARIAEVILKEEKGFFETIDAGLERLDVIFATGATVIPGDEAFRLFDTFGFPIDLTELIAAERGVTVDLAGFDTAMQEQRERSRAVRLKGQGTALKQGELSVRIEHGKSHFVGYDRFESDTEPLTSAADAAAGVLVLQESPFYATSGGQTADTGVVTGDGWRFLVDDVQKDPDLGQRLIGRLEGSFAPGLVHAAVDATRRHDIERNHSATHLAHLELRRALGAHVRQQGSLVEPGRLRFDFSHHAPIEAAQLADIEAAVNALILSNDATSIREMALPEALALGAMAFFADKYGDVVRVVQIGDSIELCGGTHVGSAGEIGLFRFTSQGGVAAGVRRIEATTGRQSYAHVRELEVRLARLAIQLRSQPDQLERKLDALLAEREKLEGKLAEALKSGGGAAAKQINAGGVTLHVSSTVTEDRSQLGELADTFRSAAKSAAVLALVNPAVPTAVAFAVTDDLIARGKDANMLMKLVTARFGGRGGGRPTFASGSLGVASAEQTVIDELPGILQEWIAG